MTIDGNNSRRVSLSASGLLELADRRRVARIDLSEVGYSGIIYVCDLTAGQQQRLMSGPSRGRTRVYPDKSMDVDWADMPRDAAARFLEACLVTDSSDGSHLEVLFESGDGRYIVVPSSELVYVADQLLAELKKPSVVREKLESLPNVVVNLAIRAMREISGMAEDVLEEKKDVS